MRIVIDLMACQSSGSRTRGIGRYSMALAQAMARQAGEHEIWLVLSDLFPDTIQPIREAFEGLVPHERIRVWHTPGPVSTHEVNNSWRRRAGELVREQVLAELRPDIVHVSSLFEGFVDNALTHVSALPEHLPTAVTLYDLIPLVNAERYLSWPPTRDWFHRKLNALKNADLLLAISESSRQEGLSWLHLAEDRVVNISSAVSEHFQPQDYPAEDVAQLRATYGLDRPYVMYTGGIDFRKNIEGLIRAFAALPTELRKKYQLAVVCSAQQEDKDRLLKLAASEGLTKNDLVMTGFVPDAALPVLYNECALFVFPSVHEGFGLPALEAMACGAPTIGSNTSSLPEVIGLHEAMFDPRDDTAITAAMQRALTDEAFRERLKVHGLQQAKKFSWDASARTALRAFEAFHAQRLAARAPVSVPQRKPKLAYLSPLRPARSGIADYSAELLPELAHYYDIELVVCQPEISDPELIANYPVRDWRWFDQHAARYERVVYHFGNSEFHSHMFALLQRHPGVVVMHDFFMSGMLAYLEARNEMPGGWQRALYESHGYHALLARKRAREEREAVMEFPCNSALLSQSDGVIVHADYSIQLARQWYGEDAPAAWAKIPHLRCTPRGVDRAAMRAQLGYAEDDFVVSSFGILAPTKLNHRLLEAFLASPLAKDPRCRLTFVGANDGGDYGQQLLRTIKNSGIADRITITGFADTEVFRAHLAASDVGVQLRTMSRGETSGTVLDCMSYGLPTILNAHGTMAELPEHTVLRLADEFTDQALVDALTTLFKDPVARTALSQRTFAYLRSAHAPAKIAKQYVEAIERFATVEPRARRRRTIAAIAALDAPVMPSDDDMTGVAEGLAASFVTPRLKHILVDVSGLQAGAGNQALSSFIARPPAGYRVEPVTIDAGVACYARAFTCALLELPPAGDDEAIDAGIGDVYIGSADQEALVRRGVQRFATLDDFLGTLQERAA